MQQESGQRHGAPGQRTPHSQACTSRRATIPLCYCGYRKCTHALGSPLRWASGGEETPARRSAFPTHETHERRPLMANPAHRSPYAVNFDIKLSIFG